MMKVVLSLCALTLFVSLGGWAQTTKSTTKSSTATSASAKAMNMTGTVSSNGKTFVADKTKKSWTIDNPDAVKADEGHRVTLNAVENSANDTLHVNSAKTMKTGKTKS